MAKRSEAMSLALADVMAGGKSVAQAANARGVSRQGIYQALGAQNKNKRKGAKKGSLAWARRNRQYQARHRGSARSYKTEAENLGLLMLWEAEVISEGQIAKMLCTDILSVRIMREDAIKAALVLAEQLDKEAA